MNHYARLLVTLIGGCAACGGAPSTTIDRPTGAPESVSEAMAPQGDGGPTGDAGGPLEASAAPGEDSGPMVNPPPAPVDAGTNPPPGPATNCMTTCVPTGTVYAVMCQGMCMGDCRGTCDGVTSTGTCAGTCKGSCDATCVLPGPAYCDGICN